MNPWTWVIPLAVAVALAAIAAVLGVRAIDKLLPKKTVATPRRKRATKKLKAPPEPKE